MKRIRQASLLGTALAMVGALIGCGGGGLGTTTPMQMGSTGSMEVRIERSGGSNRVLDTISNQATAVTVTVVPASGLPQSQTQNFSVSSSALDFGFTNLAAGPVQINVVATNGSTILDSGSATAVISLGITASPTVSLTPSGSTPTLHQFAFVSTSGAGNGIETFTINGQGVIQPGPTSTTVGTAGTHGLSVAPSGAFLVAVFGNQLQGFTINSTTGALTPGTVATLNLTSFTDPTTNVAFTAATATQGLIAVDSNGNGAILVDDANRNEAALVSFNFNAATGALQIGNTAADFATTAAGSFYDAFANGPGMVLGTSGGTSFVELASFQLGAGAISDVDSYSLTPVAGEAPTLTLAASFDGGGAGVTGNPGNSGVLAIAALGNLTIASTALINDKVVGFNALPITAAGTTTQLTNSQKVNTAALGVSNAQVFGAFTNNQDTLANVFPVLVAANGTISQFVGTANATVTSGGTEFAVASAAVGPPAAALTGANPALPLILVETTTATGTDTTLTSLPVTSLTNTTLGTASVSSVAIPAGTVLGGNNANTFGDNQIGVVSQFF